MIEVKNIYFEYDKKTKVINDFSMRVDEGEIVTIQGSSGLGKSTILRIIAGLEKPKSGKVLIDNIDITNLPTNRRNVGYVFQNHALFPHLTVRKNIAYGLPNTSDKEKMIKDVAEKVEVLELLDRYPHEISGGQKQRVAIARSLVTKPKVLLLDEPFTGLDQNLKVTIRRDVQKILNKFNITTILVTHDLEDAKALVSRVIQL